MSSFATPSVAVSEKDLFGSGIRVKKVCSKLTAGENLKQSDLNIKKKAVKYGGIPRKFDLRDEDLVTSVKLQAPYGTCWAFGACSAAETSILSRLGMTNTEYKEKYGEELNLSEKQIAYWTCHPTLETDPIYPGQVG